MAVTETKRFHWKPDFSALAQKLDVKASDAPLFERAYQEAVRCFSPHVLYQVAQLEAMGDSFVLLSGVFIEDEKAARTLTGANCMYVFTVAGVEPDAEMEWLLTLSEVAARDCARAWADDLMEQTGERFRLIFFPQTKEWSDLFSLPNDQMDRLFGVAYSASCGGCRCGVQKCAGCCAQKVQ